MKKPLVRLNAVDKLIGVFSPQKAFHRGRIRATMDFMAGSVSRTGGSNKGTLSNWLTRRINRFSEERERVTITDRAGDLVANNPHAASIIDSTTLNTVGGKGLVPQSRPNFKVLGIDEEQAEEIAEQAEYWFGVWSTECDAEGICSFPEMLYQTAYSLFKNGEYLNLPVQMDVGVDRHFSFALQALDNLRLRTPHNMRNDKDVRDGIRLGSHNQPVTYYIADPDDGRLTTNLQSQSFQPIAARRGHQPNIFHGFHKKDAEQVRGVSILAPIVKLFKDYDDYIDFHIVGEILAASFPVFIETPLNQNPEGSVGDDVIVNNAGQRIKTVNPGTVTYGEVGQKPHILKSERSQGFGIFLETVQRALGAGVGLPYEIVAKDFSKTNYSSARAALLEAYRVFCFYQSLLETKFCQPVWAMVFEEAWLRGRIKLPKGAPDFYTARAAYTNAKWTPPKRGSIDPVKEVASGKEAIISNMGTLADWYAEQGQDWQEALRQIARERKLMKDLNLTRADLPGFDLGKLATQPDQQ